MKNPPAEPVRHIPWGYGVTRVTAMAVDPERLYAYWEVTDPDLEEARSSMTGGVEARLVLRIHDTTGLIFDGTNAHGSFDVPIQRSDRQWFLDLNRPQSSAVVEVGLVGPLGAFVSLARSARVDFPRREPAPPSEPQWRIAREVIEEGAPVRKQVHLDPVPGESQPGLASDERWATKPAAAGSEERLRSNEDRVRETR